MISYVAPVKDYSGYGEASRHTVGALLAADVEVTTELLKYTAEASDFGKLGEQVNATIDLAPDYKIRIIHTTPDEYKRLIVPGKYHIGQFYWETDRIPAEFVTALNLVDEVWTGSQANKEAIETSGVRKPIYIFPQATDTEREWPKPYVIDGFDGTLFYSIFEWIDRKNPEALLKAYYEEFNASENVGLLIKTYFRNFTLHNKRIIRQQIEKIKNEMGLKEYPPVFLYMDLMDRHQIARLHKTGDVFVSAHRGEGWGVPQVEAMLAGKPVISTGWSGVHEYIDGAANLVDYTMEPVRGMRHASHWYSSDQQWAEIDKGQLKRTMRSMYSISNKQRKQVGDMCAKTAKDLFNFKTVGKLMADRIKEIEETI